MLVQVRCPSWRESKSTLWEAQEGALPQNYGYRRKGVRRRSTVTAEEGVTVTRKSVEEYMAAQRERYVRGSRVERTRLLDEIAAVTRYHRKAIIRHLSGDDRRAPGQRP